MKTYQIEVFTGDKMGAGTDANVFLTLYGEYGDSGEKKLIKSDTHVNKFERNQVKIFYYLFFNLNKIKNANYRFLMFLAELKLKGNLVNHWLN